MARSLIIGGAPPKGKANKKYLGRNYTVKPPIAHVMDFPKKTIGTRHPDEEPKKKKKGKKGKAAAEKTPRKPITLDDAKIFEPTLQIISGKGKVINDLRKRSEEHTSELQSPCNLVCRLLLEKKKHSPSQ